MKIICIYETLRIYLNTKIFVEQIWTLNQPRAS